MIKLFTISIVFIICLTAIGKAQYYETSVDPRISDQFKKADYRIWLPPQVKTIKGIIFRQHGCGTGAASTGLDHANDLQWQALAIKHDMALMGSHLEFDEICAQWFDPDGGSERAFLTALKNFAALSKHNEIEKVPWAFWGHSGGAYWCTNMLFKYPDRILVVVNRSGGIATSTWNEELKKVPVLWAVGQHDIVDGSDYLIALTIKSFSVYRSHGALWAIAIDPEADHGNRHGRSIYIPYMDAMISMRLPKDGFICRTLDTSNAWLGKWKSKEICQLKKDSTYLADAWFPNQLLAQQWMEFCKTGWVTDATLPPAPFDVHLVRENSQIHLVWEAIADIESGLKQFNIYKNGKLLTSLQGQSSNFGDVGQPKQVTFSLLLQDENGVYSVSSLNHQGLESKKIVLVEKNKVPVEE